MQMLKTAELKEVYNVLENDFQLALRSCADNDCSYSRRILIRNAAALIEGFVNQLANFTINAIETLPPKVFSLAEIAVLKEEGYQLDNQGKVRTNRNHANLQSRLLFNCKCYLRLFGQTYSIKTDKNGWNCLKQLIMTRNKLMHPKSLDDLEVSDMDIENCERALDWFGTEAARVIDLGNEAYYKALEDSQ